MVPVEQPRGDQPDNDPTEHAVVDLSLFARLIEFALQNERGHGLEHRLHHQIADHRRQSGGTVGLAGKPDGHTHGEQQREVGEQGTAGRAHGLEERPDDRRLDPTQQVVLAEPQQDAGRRQHRDRQHEALAQPLKLGETRYVQP